MEETSAGEDCPLVSRFEKVYAIIILGRFAESDYSIGRIKPYNFPD